MVSVFNELFIAVILTILFGVCLLIIQQGQGARTDLSKKRNIDSVLLPLVGNVGHVMSAQFFENGQQVGNMVVVVIILAQHHWHHVSMPMTCSRHVASSSNIKYY
jgi:hypothetical protein